MTVLLSSEAIPTPSVPYIFFISYLCCYCVSATSTIPLSSPQSNGSNNGSNSKMAKPGGAAADKQTTALNSSKLDTIKAWSLNTYKCTRQIISERFGKGSKTVDLELESQIEALRDTQRKYANILRLARALTNHFYHVVQTQRALGESFSELSQKSPDLQEEFSYNAETQKTLCKNGETLLGKCHLLIVRSCLTHSHSRVPLEISSATFILLKITQE